MMKLKRLNDNNNDRNTKVLLITNVGAIVGLFAGPGGEPAMERFLVYAGVTYGLSKFLAIMFFNEDSKNLKTIKKYIRYMRSEEYEKGVKKQDEWTKINEDPD